MKRILEKDVLGGLLLVSISSLAAFEIRDLPLGNIKQMGPGMFPALICGVLLLFGLAQLAIGFWRASGTVEFSTRKVVAVLVAIALFAVTITRFGFVPAVCITLLVLSFGDASMRLSKSIWLCVALSALVYVVFFLGLGLQVKPFAWSL